MQQVKVGLSFETNRHAIRSRNNWFLTWYAFLSFFDSSALRGTSGNFLQHRLNFKIGRSNKTAEYGQTLVQVHTSQCDPPSPPEQSDATVSLECRSEAPFSDPKSNRRPASPRSLETKRRKITTGTRCFVSGDWITRALL